VAVNLEVVRVLSARAGGGEQVTRFAGVAAEQLELLVRQVEALLGVTRATDGVADVAAVARQLHALLERAGAAGGTLRLESVDGVTAPTSVRPDLVRLLLAGLLARLVDAPAGGVLHVRSEDDGRVAVTAIADPAPAAWLDGEACALADAGGVAVVAAGDEAFTLIFPAASPATTV
jgi:hypothetical protein